MFLNIDNIVMVLLSRFDHQKDKLQTNFWTENQLPSSTTADKCKLWTYTAENPFSPFYLTVTCLDLLQASNWHLFQGPVWVKSDQKQDLEIMT